MTCERAQEFLSDYLEQAMAAAQRAELELHLAGCSACREELDALRETFRALAAVPQLDPPQELAWQVMRHVRAVRRSEREARRGSLAGLRDWLFRISPARVAVGAALATLIVGGLVTLNALPPHTVMGPVNPRDLQGRTGTPVAQPVLTVREALPGADGLSLKLRFQPGETPDGSRLEMLGPAAEPLLDQPIRRGEVVEIPVLVAQANGTAQSFRLQLRTPTETRPLFLVVAPLVRNGDRPFTAVLEDRPLEEALRELAPHVGRPVVVDGRLDGRIHLGVQDARPMDVLQTIADRIGAQVQAEGESYVLQPRR